MIRLSDQFYLSWQKQLTARRLLRYITAALAIYSVVVLFFIGGFLSLRGQWQVVALAIIAFVLARLIVSPVIYLFFKKQRPYQRLKFVTVYSWLMSRKTAKQNSFPSDHAISFASIAMVFFWYMAAVGITIAVLAVLNGISRVLLGYHDVWDILGGWILGVLCALFIVFSLGPLLFTH
jgi:membrane-associated phospholipid phosphatase